MERDLRLDIRRGFIFGVEFVQLADFIPSVGSHVDSVLIPASLFPDVVSHLVELAQQITSWRSAR